MNSHEHQSSISITSNAEDEHFHLAEALISWMECFKSTCDDDPAISLSSILSELTSYLGKLNDDTDLELTVLQICLMKLPWSNMLATLDDIKNLAFLSKHAGPNMSDLVSHIMLQIDIKKTLARIEQDSFDIGIIAKSVELLAEILTIQCNHLADIHFPENYLALVSTNSIPRLAGSMLARSSFLETRGDELLFKVLKYICIRKNDLESYVGSQTDKLKQPLTFDSFERAVIYAQFVSDYLVDLTKRIPALVQSNEKPLCRVIDNSLTDLDPILQSKDLSTDQKKILYATLLKCCNCDALDDISRLLLARLFAESSSIRNKPNMVVDMLQSIGQFLRDPKVLVNMVEILVGSCSNSTDSNEDICNSFHLSAGHVEQYLESCIEETCPIALMTYYESQLNHSTKQASVDCIETSPSQTISKQDNQYSHVNATIWASYLFSLSHLIHNLRHRSLGSLTTINAQRLITTLMRFLVKIEPDLDQFVHGVDASSNGDPNRSQLDRTRQVEPISEENSRVLVKDIHQDVEEQLSTASIEIKATAPCDVCPAPKPIIISTTDNLLSEHRSLSGFLQQLLSFSSDLLSYLEASSQSEQLIKLSLASLTIVCLLADRTLIHLVPELLSSKPHLEVFREDLVRSRRAALVKLDAARKSGSSMDCNQFVGSFMEDIQQNSKMHYGEMIQLITTFARS